MTAFKNAPFAGRTVWVTGASSGIGAALAGALAERDARLILSGRDMARLDAVAARCNTQTLVLPFDVRDEPALAEAVQAAVEWRDGVDMFVANAGVSQRSLARDTAMQVYRDIIEIDLTAQIGAVQALLPHMLASAAAGRPGRLVFMSSIAGKVGVPLRTAYCAAKHGLVGYADALRAELVRENIAVHVVLPGSVATDVSRNALTATGIPRGRSDAAIDKGLSPALAASSILDAIALEQREIVVAEGMEEAMGEARRTPDQLFDQVARMVEGGYIEKLMAEE